MKVIDFYRHQNIWGHAPDVLYLNDSDARYLSKAYGHTLGLTNDMLLANTAIVIQ